MSAYPPTASTCCPPSALPAGNVTLSTLLCVSQGVSATFASSRLSSSSVEMPSSSDMAPLTPCCSIATPISTILTHGAILPPIFAPLKSVFASDLPTAVELRVFQSDLICPAYLLSTPYLLVSCRNFAMASELFAALKTLLKPFILVISMLNFFESSSILLRTFSARCSEVKLLSCLSCSRKSFHSLFHLPAFDAAAPALPRASLRSAPASPCTTRLSTSRTVKASISSPLTYFSIVASNSRGNWWFWCGKGALFPITDTAIAAPPSSSALISVPKNDAPFRTVLVCSPLPFRGTEWAGLPVLVGAPAEALGPPCGGAGVPPDAPVWAKICGPKTFGVATFGCAGGKSGDIMFKPGCTAAAIGP